MYPVQYLAVPCMDRGPNLPFQWFLPSLWKWCSSHAEQLPVPLISQALLTRLQVPSLFLKIDLHLHPPPKSLAFEVIFFEDPVQELIFFSVGEKICNRNVKPPFGDWSGQNLKWGTNSFSSSLLHCPSCLRFCPNLHFYTNVPRALYTFLLALNLPLQPRIRMTYICFTILLDHKLPKDQDWGINPCTSPEGTVMDTTESFHDDSLNWANECICFHPHKGGIHRIRT